MRHRHTFQLALLRRRLFSAGPGWCLLAILAGLPGCKYDPDLDGKLTCTAARGCPTPLTCRPRSSGGGICCRDHCPPDVAVPQPTDGPVGDLVPGDGGKDPDGSTLDGTDATPADADPQTTCMQRACSAASPDACCPPGCTAQTDVDCAGCGNGFVEPEKGETCDPPETCPTACPPVTCTTRTLQGSAATCNAACIDTPITQCSAGDACCPAGCTAATDPECGAVCGNDVKEPGEMCEPVAECARQEGACQSTEDVIKEKTGQAALCTFACIEKPRPCLTGDGFCPSTCTAATDSDCPGCGNGRVEAPETCDPPADCMHKEAMCVSDRDVVRTKVGNSLICNFTCHEMPRPCGDDGLCPASCNARNDRDCPGCGNEKVEPGEHCDPPSVCKVQSDNCKSDANAIRMPTGDPAQCTFQCQVTKRPCGHGDGYCPGGCTVTNDTDCAGCGNGRIEGHETCDPPSACQMAHDACLDDATTVRTRSGDPHACSFQCVETPRGCVSGDGYCGPGCKYETDKECIKAPGEGCMSGPECTTGLCEDTRCCKASCMPCFACTGPDGACEPVKRGSTDDKCTHTLACDGAGACKLVNGQPCRTADQCLSNYCPLKLGSPTGTCTTKIVRPPLPPAPEPQPPIAG